MTSPRLADQLLGVGFFSTLPETLRWHLARAGTPSTYEPDAVLFREGDPRSFFAVILSGSVAVEHAHGSAGGLRIATLGAGEVLGEGMLLDDSPHGTAARALVRTETLVFHKEQVDPLLKDKPQLYAALVARAAQAI